MIFMKIFKKNQILIFVTALVLVTTGYLACKPYVVESNDFISTTIDKVETTDIGDAKLVNSNVIVNDILNKKTEENPDSIKKTNVEKLNDTGVNSKTVETTAKLSVNSKVEEDYYTTSRIERDKMYSQMLESYQKIIDNANISAEQKSIATNEITKINNTKNAIMIAENLIKTKGMQDVIIFVNLDSINVIIKTEEITSNKVAQVQNIVSRELGAEIENIHISKK